MVDITYSTLQSVLSIPQMSAVNIESLLDIAIDLLNLYGADLPNMTGTAGSKSVSVDGQAKAAIFLAARAIYHSDPSTFSLAELNISSGDILSNPEVSKTIKEAASVIAGTSGRRG